jgi:hypothetical protein
MSSIFLKSVKNGVNKGIQGVERAIIDVREVRAARLFGVRKQSWRAFGHRFAPPGGADVFGRRDHDHSVEERVRPGLVQERNLDDCDGCVHALEPRGIPLPDARVEQLLEPGELDRIGEDDLGDARAVGRAEPLLERSADLRILRIQLVDDLVRRQRGRSLTPERLQRLALPGADAAGDGEPSRLRGRQSARYR